MKVAIMQPYVFPYIGYFQLIESVDCFVFYDDVNFIKQGWINRNRILLNGAPFMFTIPVENISSFREIRNVHVHGPLFRIWRDKFLKTITSSYRKAPLFPQTLNIIQNVLSIEVESIGDLAESSVSMILKYLGIERTLVKSSFRFSETKGVEAADRLIIICKLLNSSHYINPIGGVDLYDKPYFEASGIALNFIKPASQIKYNQGSDNEFVPWLSIIDVMMFNSPEQIRAMLTQYDLT